MASSRPKNRKHKHAARKRRADRKRVVAHHSAKPKPSKPKPSKPTPPNDDSDLIWGAPNIGKFIKRTPRQVHFLIDSKRLPVEKRGRLIVGSKQKMLAALVGGSDAH